MSAQDVRDYLLDVAEELIRDQYPRSREANEEEIEIAHLLAQLKPYCSQEVSYDK